jgi:recombination protein RecT
MTKSLQTIDTQAVVGNFTQSELDTLKATIAKGTTNEQFALFVQTCVRSGLNPFLNQIFCIVYNGKDGPVMSIQIAVEGIVALAKRHPQYKGFIASEVKENDEFEIDVVTGEPKHRITTMQRGQTVGAYCVAYREGAPNIAVIVTRDQVEHFLKSSIPNQQKMWRDYFDDMIVKHAIKRAFKRQFGIEIAEDEYVPSGPQVESYERVRKDITNEANATTLHQEQQTPALNDGEAELIEKAKAEMKAKLKQLGITGKKAIDQYISSRVTFKGETPTLAELQGLLKIMDLEIQQMKAAEDDKLEDELFSDDELELGGELE